MMLTPEILPDGDLKIVADGLATLTAIRAEAPNAYGPDSVMLSVFESLVVIR